MAAATEPSVVLQKLAGLLEEEQGQLHLSDLSLERIGAVIELAARVPDEAQGAAALFDVVRFSIGLDEAGHPKLAERVKAQLQVSPAALLRLQGARERDKATFERFARFTHVDRNRRAPQIDATPSEAGLALKDLLPPGGGRRLDRGATRSADASREAPPDRPEGPRARRPPTD